MVLGKLYFLSRDGTSRRWADVIFVALGLQVIYAMQTDCKKGTEK